MVGHKMNGWRLWILAVSILLMVREDAAPPPDNSAIVSDSQASVTNSASVTIGVTNAAVNIWTVSVPADLTTATVSQVRYVTIKHCDRTDVAVGISVKVAGTGTGITPSVLTYATGFPLMNVGETMQVNIRRAAGGAAAAAANPIMVIAESAATVDTCVTFWW